MLDDSDLDFAIFAGLGGGFWGTLIGLLIVIVVAVCVCDNHKECSKMTCPDGQSAELMAHQCLCVTKAQPATPKPMMPQRWQDLPPVPDGPPRQ